MLLYRHIRVNMHATRLLKLAYICVSVSTECANLHVVMPSDDIGIDLISIGERIRNRRNRLGLTQEELADTVGQERATISRLEKGKVPNPRLADLGRIASALNTNLIELLGAFDQVSPDDEMQAAFGISGVEFAKFITDDATDEEREAFRSIYRLVRHRRNLRRLTDPQ